MLYAAAPEGEDDADGAESGEEGESQGGQIPASSPERSLTLPELRRLGLPCPGPG